MGVVKNITHEKFPQQSGYVGHETKVCFHYDTDNFLKGTIVRDDKESPHMTLIRLEDGRHVLATECQWSPPAGVKYDGG